ncbi:MAG: uroporphyrinogen decarboxylase family protein [Spirochaetia bacterium]
MRILKLRNHIPIAGPARREPADGTESRFRVSLGFEPAWYSRRCEVSFSDQWHRDPEYRYKTLKAMKSELVRAFPGVPYWDPENSRDLATISGVHGAYPIPHAFGIPLVYGEDRWPALDPEGRLSLEEIETLEADKVLQSPVVEDIFRQMDIIEKRWGTIHGYLNWQGVLNNAFNLRGQEIFLDMFDKPELVRQFFTVITEVMIGLARKIQERQRLSGFAVDQFSVSNCVMNMISPEAYAGFVRPFDTQIAESFERFGVHTCNWDVTPYIEVLAELPRLGYLDMGMMSDMRRVRETFLDTNRAVLYSPVKLQEGSLEEIRKDMEKIYNDLGPCDLVMADIQASTADERVQAMLDMCADIEKKGRA